MTSIKFKVPYIFDLRIPKFYSIYADRISTVYLPPYKDDAYNTRMERNSNIIGRRRYVAQNRSEYEHHINNLKLYGLNLSLLWQDRNNRIDPEIVSYYDSLGINGYTVCADSDAKLIRNISPSAHITSSITRVSNGNITDEEYYMLYDKIVLMWSYNRAIETLMKFPESLQKKIILLINTWCCLQCTGVKHWYHLGDYQAECKIQTDIRQSAFIYPEHLNYFDKYVREYKLEGRDCLYDEIVDIVSSYMNRITSSTLLPKQRDIIQKQELDRMGVNNYYNINSKQINY